MSLSGISFFKEGIGNAACLDPLAPRPGIQLYCHLCCCDFSQSSCVGERGEKEGLENGRRKKEIRIEPNQQGDRKEEAYTDGRRGFCYQHRRTSSCPLSIDPSQNFTNEHMSLWKKKTLIKNATVVLSKTPSSNFLIFQQTYRHYFSSSQQSCSANHSNHQQTKSHLDTRCPVLCCSTKWAPSN